ncbi:hypothetical protein [Oleispirillum naphthae]|uniref:hypothetical protein n=1 Tax=Oleispirillum naphthae TaxID=2838853 RepID=UPI0030825222
MRMWGTVAAGLIALCGGVARAGETFPSDVRTITATGATSSCIGDPKTPVCAVETLLACFARRAAPLCRSVTARPFSADAAPPRTVSYRLLWLLTSRAKDDRSGTVYATLAVERLSGSWTDIYVHFLESVGSGWRIEEWGTPGEIGLPLRIDPRKTEILEKYGSVPLVTAYAVQ